MAIVRDTITFAQPVTFSDTVTFADTPAEIVITSLTGLQLGASGAGTVDPALTLKKTAASSADVNFKAADDLRGRVRLNSAEAIVIETFDADEVSTGTITMSNAAGAVALSGALAVTGTTTCAALACTTLAASGAVTCATTLGVTGATTAAAIACTTLAASGAVTCATTLGVTGATTCAALACTTFAPSGAVTAAAAVSVGTTLAVTGASTLAAVACTTLAPSGAVTCAGAVSVGTTLAVTGTATMAAINASGTVAAAGAMTVGTTLAVTGTTTAAAINASGTIAAAGAVTVGTTLGITGTTTAAAVNSTALAASTSLTVTGATVVGLHEHVTVAVALLNGTAVYGFASPVAGTITKIQSRLDAALATGNATITAKIGAVAVTTGVLTITEAGSVAGDVDVCNPSGANTVVVGSDVNFTVGGTNSAAVGATVTVTFLRSA